MPTGPVSAWPQERNVAAPNMKAKWVEPSSVPEVITGVRVGLGEMASGLLRSAGQALAHGKVSEEIREERYNTCKQCPFFLADSKRCSECGCFMEAKTWIGGDPNMLCPKQIWSR